MYLFHQLAEPRITFAEEGEVRVVCRRYAVSIQFAVKGDKGGKRKGGGWFLFSIWKNPVEGSS